LKYWDLKVVGIKVVFKPKIMKRKDNKLSSSTKHKTMKKKENLCSDVQTAPLALSCPVPSAVPCKLKI